MAFQYSPAMPARFDLAALTRALGSHARRFDADWLAECDSTNRVLMARAEAGAPSGSVIIAGWQTAGRGRLGRAWLSAPDDSLTFSLFWRFAPRTAPAGLSLAVGLAVAAALEKLGVGRTAGLALKWPNDLLLGSQKLGGILVELLPGAPHAAVIGIGLNLRLPDAMPDEIKTQAAALPVVVTAESLLGAVLIELASVLDRFAVGGFAALREAWLAWHAHTDRYVSLLAANAPSRHGRCRGVAEDGALLLEVDGRIERILSGDVSLRTEATT